MNRRTFLRTARSAGLVTALSLFLGQRALEADAATTPYQNPCRCSSYWRYDSEICNAGVRCVKYRACCGCAPWTCGNNTKVSCGGSCGPNYG